MKNIWKVKPIKLHFNLDTDKDRVPDFMDCRPFNPKRQHVTPSQTMRKRLRNLPMYVTDKPVGDSKIVGYHVATRAARKEAPEATKKFYATIKKYPSVVGDLERTQPKEVYFSSVPAEPGEKYEGISGWEGGKTVFVRPPTPVYGISEEEYFKGQAQKEEVPFIFPSEETAAEAEARSRKLQAMTFHHELAHVRQEKKFGEDISDELSRFYGYEDKPTEIEARAAASREMAKYEKVPTKNQVRKWFEREYE